jgi:hypothetical protein
MQALRYGRLLTALKVISSSDWKAWRTSSVNFFIASGLLRSKYVTPESKVAVVSAPATTRRVLLASRAGTSRFYYM